MSLPDEHVFEDRDRHRDQCVRAGLIGSGAPRVPLQRGLQRNRTGQDGRGRDNEPRKIKAMVGNGLSCLKFLLASHRVRVPPWALSQEGLSSRDGGAFSLTRCVCSKRCSKSSSLSLESPPEFAALRSSSTWPTRRPMLSFATSSHSAFQGSVVYS